MTTVKQIQMVMKDLLFITWTARPESVRRLVHPSFEIDTIADSEGRSNAFVSAVCFRVEDVRSNVLPLPQVSFEQVNYRAYVTADGVPSVGFLDMRLNSRMVTMLTGFLRVPVSYDDITINVIPQAENLLRYEFKSSGLNAEVIIGETSEVSPEPLVSSEFITQRLTGYAGTDDNAFRLDVDHPVLSASPARVADVNAPRLVELGVLASDQESNPHSAWYVPSAIFETDTPARAFPERLSP